MEKGITSRIRYLIFDLPPEGIEVLSSFLSLSFAVVLFANGHRSNAIDRAYFYGGLCFSAAITKLVGVVWQIWVVRVLGLLLGVVFWCTVSVAFLLTIPGSISWLCFMVLAVSQIWAVRQVWRQTR